MESGCLCVVTLVHIHIILHIAHFYIYIDFHTRSNVFHSLRNLPSPLCVLFPFILTRLFFTFESRGVRQRWIE